MNRSTDRAVQIAVETDEPSKPLKPFFSVVGYVNVDFTLTAATERMYDYFSSFHNHFLDMGVEKGNTYQYRLQAVNASGAASGYSEELIVSIS